jgi:RecA/RadA recombinase
MGATITGNFKHVNRVSTGYYSLDRAFMNDQGEIGVPVGVGYEIFGTNGIGKSTFTFSLCGMLGRILDKNVVIAALEDFDGSLLLRLVEFAQFCGNVHVLDGKDDETILGDVVAYLYKPDYALGVVDSLGAISPISEQSGDIGEANMGRRAMAVAQLTRKCMPLLRPDNSIKTVFLLNHYYPKIGTRGWDTPAGETKKFMVSIRILIRRVEDFPDGSYVLEGEIKKNRWGFNGRKFSVFVLVGRGLHRGLSAVWDCVTLKHASYKNGIVKIGDEKFGRLSSLVKAAKEGNEEIFLPFYAALESVEPEQPEEVEGEPVAEAQE